MPFIYLLMLPVLEIYLFIKVGAEIGVFAVLIWLVGAVFLGMNILRFLGATAMLNAARQMQTGAAPAHTLADGLLKAVAAVLFIIPGFATDFLAILLFISPLRQLLLKRWLRKFALKSSVGSAGFGAKNDSYTGNVYDHKGDSHPTSDAQQGRQDGQVLEHKPDKK